MSTRSPLRKASPPAPRRSRSPTRRRSGPSPPASPSSNARRDYMRDYMRTHRGKAQRVSASSPPSVNIGQLFFVKRIRSGLPWTAHAFYFGLWLPFGLALVVLRGALLIVSPRACALPTSATANARSLWQCNHVPAHDHCIVQSKISHAPAKKKKTCDRVLRLTPHMVCPSVCRVPRSALCSA